MDILLEGKRIFEVEDAAYDYVIFPGDRIQTYLELNGYLIKQGNLQYPNKWINMEDASYTERLILESAFHPEEYECLFFDDLGLKEAIQNILSPYNIQIDNDIKNLLKIDEIPEQAAIELKTIFNSEKYANNYADPLDFARYEGYEYEHNGELKRWFIGEEELPCTSITYDATIRFMNKYIVETYYKEAKNHAEHVFRTNTGEWFRYYVGDEENNYWIMKDIEDEELVNFPFSQYTLLETKPRQIPEKEPDIEIDWSKFIDKDTPYDFYYSEKAFNLRILQNQTWNDLVYINGEWNRFTKKVAKGEKTLEKLFEPWEIQWDDVVFIGSGTFGDIKEGKFTKQEMEQLYEEIKKKSYANAVK